MDEHFRHYIVLGVSASAKPEEIKRAYRSLVKRWHPDRMQADSRRKREAEEQLRRITMAYSALMDARRSGSQGERMRPAAPGFDPVSWRQGVAENGAAEFSESDQAFYSRALDLHFRGIDDFRSGRLRDAISRLTQSVGMVQNNPEAYRTLGRAHRRLNQLAKACAAYQQAVWLEPNSGESRFEFGSLLAALGDIAAAQREADRLGEIDPELAAELRSSLS